MMIDSQINEELTNYGNLIEDTGANRIYLDSNKEFVNFFVSGSIENESVTKKAHKTAFVLERISSDALLNEPSKHEIELINKWLEKAFVCRRSYIYSSEINLKDIFYFSITGVMSKSLSQVRVILKNVELPPLSSSTWDKMLIDKIMKATILLIRKNGGWSDIEESIDLINELRKEQSNFEKAYIEEHKEKVVPELIMIYNLAKIVDLTAQYTLNGSPSNILTKIHKHYDNANSATKYSVSDDLYLFKDMLYLGCKQLIKNTIWYNSRNLVTNVKMREYINSLTNSDHPIIELLPSQQAALEEDPLSIVKRSIVLSMPTSAGKTMMAEFAIIQAISGNQFAKVIYLVPTRALVNQITLNLRKKFSKLDLIVESTVPVFELDSIEDKFLRDDCNILVSTPEKIDLLLREKHPSIDEISLVIVDEAHNIQSKERGAKLELLLSTLNKERTSVRFLLLSPFIPNSDQISSWLGGDQSKSIRVDWKASEQVTAVSYVSSKSKKEFLVLNIIPSLNNMHVKEEFNVIFHENIAEGNRGSIKKSSVSTALNLISDDGCVLILCRTKSDTNARAQELFTYLEDIELDEESKLIVKFIEEELGSEHILPNVLKKGIAIHHSGISIELRSLIERLVENGNIKVLAATTTLAQGVNFPIKHVIIESISVPSIPPYNMTQSEFWNIAGRAGRAFYDNMGLIVFAGKSKTDVEKYKEYLAGTTDSLLSSILLTLYKLEEQSIKFDLKFVRSYPELAVFLQYLLHMVRVSSYHNVKSDLEDTLRLSLVYHQLERNSKDGDKLLSLAKKYLESIGVIAENKGYQDLIDRTGFSSISVGALFAKSKDNNVLNGQIWNPDTLFSFEDKSMDRIIETLKDIPEVDLGKSSGGELDVSQVSKIIKAWVNGDSLIDISQNYFYEESDYSTRVFKASNYINSQLTVLVSWGLNALQKLLIYSKDDIRFDEINHIPALIYFGTKSKEALSLRMVGVPRNVSEGLVGQYNDKFAEDSPSLSDIRSWLTKLDADKWAAASKYKTIEGKDLKKIWMILNGFE